MTEQLTLGLPYLEITKVAAQKKLRELNITRGKETYWIDFSRLKERTGFNFRKQYSSPENTIEDFTLFILANGLPAPLVVDVLEDGTVYIEQGYRRFRCLSMIDGQGLLMDLNLPHLKGGEVECYVNDNTIDELTRIKRQFSSNNSVKYTPLELGEICKTLEIYFSLNQTEIGKHLNMSRQHVKNHLILAEQSDVVKQAISSGKLKVTAAVDLARALKDNDAVTEKVQESVSSGKAIHVSDVKKIQGEGGEDLKELPGASDQSNESEKQETDSSASAEKEINPGVASHNVNGDGSDSKEVKDEKKSIKYDESREEIYFIQNVIKNNDKLNTVVGKLNVNDQVKKDINGLVELNQQYLEKIREWIHNNKKYNKKAI